MTLFTSDIKNQHWRTDANGESAGDTMFASDVKGQRRQADVNVTSVRATLFSTDFKENHRRMAKTGFVYLFATLFLVLFGAVYERFSHEVYSYYMLYAFAIPLAGGVLPFFSLAFSNRLPMPGRVVRNLYHSAIATLTVGSCFAGVLEIYGTTNSLIKVYWIVGGGFLACAIILYLAAIHSRS
ncbi:MAG: head-tail connector protein [Lachnospiraceae bacterium]|nr:head-tail connector protein [Lachnospiraceae bacterium]